MEKTVFFSSFCFSSLTQHSLCKDSVVESGVCGSVSEFDIAGTGAVYIEKRMKEHFVFPSRRAGSRSESKAEDSVVTSRDKKDCKEKCSSGVKF